MPDPTTAPAGLSSAGMPAAAHGALQDGASWASQVLHYLRANPGLLASATGAGRS